LATRTTSSQDRHDATTASIKKPIHNVKEQTISGLRNRQHPKVPRNMLSSSLEYRNGGAYRDRTDDPLLAKQVLSQLS
jgi:hypothetical protein